MKTNQKRKAVDYVEQTEQVKDVVETNDFNFNSVDIFNKVQTDEMTDFEKAERFRNVQLPWIVVITFTIFFTYIVMHSWRLI